MRIAFVSVEYPPFRGGGIGTYTLNMSRFLVEAGHEVHVIANSWVEHADTPPPSFERQGNLYIHRIDALTNDYGPRPPFDRDESPVGKVCRWWDSSLFWSLLAADELERVCREYSIEVVEYPECYAESYLALRRRRLGRKGVDVPMTVTLHSPIHEVTVHNLYRMYEGWFQRRTMMENYCIKNADMLSCPSKALADIVTERLGLDPDRYPCEVIHNPMDFASLPPLAPGARERADAKPTLLTVGRVEPRKGIKYLLDAASLIMDRHPDLTVHFIGKDCDAGEVPGSTVEFMRSRVRPELRDRFIFEGLRPRSEVLERYATCSAYVHPAPWDNFPYTCAEAMAYGACVVSSDNGGMAEMIENGESGVLVKARDIRALADGLDRVLVDAELRERCRRNAPGRIRALCDPSLAVQKRIDHYRRTIERHQMLAVDRKVFAAPRGKRLAAFLPNHTGVPAIKHTITSLEKSAVHAGVDLHVSVIGTNQYHDLEVPYGVVEVAHSRRDGDASAIDLWLRMIESQPVKPDYLMTFWPSETVDEDYLALCQGILESDPRRAWATTWGKSCHVGSQEPYAGFDFSVPLEMMFYHPVPYALIRYQAFLEVGGWNLELPNGYRQWDLWLAFEQAGYEGIVLPEWHGEYIPYSRIKLEAPEHPKAHELALEGVTRRNRRLFLEHGVDLWVAHMTNRLPPTKEVPEPPAPLPLEDSTAKELARALFRRLGRLARERWIPAWFAPSDGQRPS